MFKYCEINKKTVSYDVFRLGCIILLENRVIPM